MRKTFACAITLLTWSCSLLGDDVTPNPDDRQRMMTGGMADANPGPGKDLGGAADVGAGQDADGRRDAGTDRMDAESHTGMDATQDAGRAQDATQKPDMAAVLPPNAVHVTNLNDSGSGSLRACVEGTGARTCVFDLGGTITLNARLDVQSSNSQLVVDGSTAPSPVTLKGDGSDEPLMVLSNGAHDVTVRHLRFRKGPGGGQDNIAINGSKAKVYGITFDHNSFSWATDENINTYRDADDITFSWNIIAEPLHCSTHSKGCHGKNGAMGKYNTGSQSFHHNLIMSAHDRSLKVNSAYGTVQFANNVMYNNYDVTNINYDADTSENGPMDLCINIVGNTWLDGPDSDQEGQTRPQLRADDEVSGHTFLVHLSDNKAARVEVSDDLLTMTPCPGLPTVTSSALAYTEVLAGAGATLPSRDATDTRLIQEVGDRTGSWKDDVPTD